MPSFRLGPAAAALALTGLLGSVSCAGGPSPDVPGPNHMYEHFGQVAEIQDAVILGDIDATRGPARWLASHRGEDVSAEASEAVESMRNEARIIARQTDVLELARAVGRMGVACGSCHTATDGGPELEMQSPPPASGTDGAHMRRHAWAMERLWEGLYAPSDPAWSAGAGALLGMPSDFGMNDQANRLARRVHELGRKAQGARSAQERVGTYAELLESCSLCHGTLGLRLNR